MQILQEIQESAIAKPALLQEVPKSSESDVEAVSESQQKSSSPNRTLNQLTKEESMDDENMDLDFEEISEDELDEETRVKGLGDALGVDWASLVAESRPRIMPTNSVKRRWGGHNILVNLGISVDMAGEELVKRILKEHADIRRTEEKKEADGTEIGVNGISRDNTEAKSEVQISHPVAAIQVSLRSKELIRKNLFASVGPFRRALSARSDLIIRRHLCNLPVKDKYVEAPKQLDPELLKIATELFERSL